MTDREKPIWEDKQRLISLTQEGQLVHDVPVAWLIQMIEQDEKYQEMMRDNHIEELREISEALAEVQRILREIVDLVDR